MLRGRSSSVSLQAMREANLSRPHHRCSFVALPEEPAPTSRPSSPKLPKIVVDTGVSGSTVPEDEPITPDGELRGFRARMLQLIEEFEQVESENIRLKLELSSTRRNSSGVRLGHIDENQEEPPGLPQPQKFDGSAEGLSSIDGGAGGERMSVFLTPANGSLNGEQMPVLLTPADGGVSGERMSVFLNSQPAPLAKEGNTTLASETCLEQGVAHNLYIQSGHVRQEDVPQSSNVQSRETLGRNKSLLPDPEEKDKSSKARLSTMSKVSSGESEQREEDEQRPLTTRGSVVSSILRGAILSSRASGNRGSCGTLSASSMRWSSGKVRPLPLDAVPLEESVSAAGSEKSTDADAMAYALSGYTFNTPSNFSSSESLGVVKPTTLAASLSEALKNISIMCKGRGDKDASFSDVFASQEDSMTSSISGHTLNSERSEDAPKEQRPWYVLSPVGATRLCWDAVWCLCLVFEIWAVPFRNIFLAHDGVPDTLRSVMFGIRVFYLLDIAVNFTTGFVVGDSIVRDPRQIVKHYVFGWLLIDILAVAPLEFLWGTSRWNSLLRVVKLTHFMPTIAHIRLMNDRDAVCRTGGLSRSNVLTSLHRALGFTLVFLSLFCISHVHGCFWGVLQDVHELPTTNAADALWLYYEGLYWAYAQFTFSKSSASNHGLPMLWTLEMIIASERLVLLAVAGVWGVFQSLVHHEEGARLRLLQHDTLRYLHLNKASPQTVQQVWNSLRETRKAWNIQRHFDEVASDFPAELQRQIHKDMWGKHLRSLQLLSIIAKKFPDLIVELAILVREESLASSTVLIREGDPSISAYRIIEGELKVSSRTITSDIPNITKGMWVGEMSLVNPDIRRNCTVTTVSFTRLMAIPAEGFLNCLERCGLTSVFKDVCEQGLWKGLCGRCGSFGDHFSDQCPYYKETSQKNLIRRGTLMFSKAESASEARRRQLGNFKEVDEFLKFIDLQRIRPAILHLGISSVQGLLDVDLDLLDSALRDYSEPSLTPAERQGITSSDVKAFYETRTEVARKLLRRGREGRHFIFLSHFKLEAGTEAALMRSELELLISDDEGLNKEFDVPVFLDSEDLSDLTALQERVLQSENVVLLLTKGFLTRPWCLFEVCTAIKHDIPVRLVKVEKAGDEFEFPTESFYARFSNGEVIDQEGINLLQARGFCLQDVISALKTTFQKIAVPYSPHKAAAIRRAELKTLMDTLSHAHAPNTAGRVWSRLASTELIMDGQSSMVF